MILILVRHGEAGERDPQQFPDDDLRPLTADGRRKQTNAARGMKQLDIVAQAMFTSPLLRAVQTAEIIAEVHGMDPAEKTDALAPGCTAQKLAELVAALPPRSSVFLVGHEPSLSHCAAAFIARNPTAEIDLKKSGVIGIEFDAVVKPGAGRLLYLLKPKFLRRARH